MKFMLISALATAIMVLVFVYFHPVFGAELTKENRESFKQSPNFLQGKFTNQVPLPTRHSKQALFTMITDFIKGNPQGRPGRSIPTERFDIETRDEIMELKITWFGHSTVLLLINGKVLLLDPMFGMYPSPVPFCGGKRYSQRPVNIDELPPIDAVLLSHDHYDHLDYHSIKKLKDKVKHFYVPLGVGSHLERWGIDSAQITCHDWWEESEFDGLTLACTPARHFSGRRLTNRNSTLWCSWVIMGADARVFFSGDGGYGPHFKEIGRKFGQFDITLMECGQYDPRWKAIHMMPEETVQAHVDLQGQLMIPIHWGAFTLSFHSWTDPVERVMKAAQQRNLTLATPRIGEVVTVGSNHYPVSAWWQDSLIRDRKHAKTIKIQIDK